ncbi:MFS transporter, partial [Arthrobacter deserti]|nr:MFS transporter [Arthrobacter deserti]
GTVQAFERVAAQTIIFELVGEAGLSQAASISTIALAAARSVGPALAGLAFQGFGAAVCILINAGAYLLVFPSPRLIRPATLPLRPSEAGDADPPAAAQSGRPASAPFRRNRNVNTLLAVNGMVSLLAMNFGLVLTSTVDLSYGGDAAAIGAVHALDTLGGVVGGILAARRRVVTVRSLVPATTLFAATLALTAAAPTLTLFLVFAPLLGVGIGYYQGIISAAAQQAVPPQFIGRMMSWMTLGGYGMVPFRALLMGWVIDAGSGRVSLALAAATALACTVLVRL